MTKPHSASLMSALVGSMASLSSKLPSFPCRVLAYRESVPADLCGTYVSLSGPHGEHIVGLLSHPLSWESLSRALDHDLPISTPRGLVEGACDIGRLVAEAFRDGAPEAGDAVIGLPLFVEGMVSGGRRLELQAADIALGGSLLLLVLFSRSDWSRRSSLQTSSLGEGAT